VGLSPVDELECVVWALNGGPLFAAEIPVDEVEWSLSDKLRRETPTRLRRFVEIWDRSGRNLKRMWRDYYDQCLFIDKCFKRLPIGLAWGDSNRLDIVHTFLDRQCGTPEEEAARFFLALIWNGQNCRLGGPCARCGKYFIRRSARHKKYCSPLCGSHATAADATLRKRAEEHADKLRRARTAAEAWPTARTKLGWKRWIAGQQPDITTNFLTRAVTRGALKAPVR
jgi:hypothetical protein